VLIVLSPKASLNIWKVSVAVFPSLKQNLMRNAVIRIVIFYRTKIGCGTLTVTLDKVLFLNDASYNIETYGE
jgi:hypothetical protein